MLTILAQTKDYVLYPTVTYRNGQCVPGYAVEEKGATPWPLASASLRLFPTLRKAQRYLTAISHLKEQTACDTTS